MQIEILTIEDLMQMFRCSKSTASRKMREIKQVSNLLNIKGKCLVDDYVAFKNRLKGVKNEKQI